MAMKPYMPTCQAVSDSVSAFIAAMIPWPNDSPRIGAMVKYWKTMPKRVGEQVVHDPDREHPVAEEPMPAESHRDRREGEDQPFGADVAQRAAAAAVQGAVANHDREWRQALVWRLLILLHGGLHFLMGRQAAISEVLP